ncbi:MAG: CHAT domain-containing protein, partial [Pseudomonadota bacterium]
ARLVWGGARDSHWGGATGFLTGGACGVVSSLWRVDRRATATLVRRLFALTARGLAPAEALRQAQLSFITEAAQEEEAAADAAESARSWRAPPQAEAARAELLGIGAAPPSDEGAEAAEDLPRDAPFYWAAFTFAGAS